VGLFPYIYKSLLTHTFHTSAQHGSVQHTPGYRSSGRAGDGGGRGGVKGVTASGVGHEGGGAINKKMQHVAVFRERVAVWRKCVAVWRKRVAMWGEKSSVLQCILRKSALRTVTKSSVKCQQSPIYYAKEPFELRKRALCTVRMSS